MNGPGPQAIRRRQPGPARPRASRIPAVPRRPWPPAGPAVVHYRRGDRARQVLDRVPSRVDHRRHTHSAEATGVCIPRAGPTEPVHPVTPPTQWAELQLIDRGRRFGCGTSVGAKSSCKTAAWQRPSTASWPDLQGQMVRFMFSNRAYWPRNNRWAEPVGPLRCFATITSASSRRSIGTSASY